MSADSPSRRSRRPVVAERTPALQSALDAALSGDAGDPIRRAMWLDELDRRLRSSLPQPLAAHARLANLDGSALVYLVDSPVWHARLRLASGELLDAARSIGLEVDRIAIRTSHLPRPRESPATSPSAQARGATAIPAALKAALASLGASTPGGKEGDSGQEPGS